MAARRFSAMGMTAARPTIVAKGAIHHSGVGQSLRRRAQAIP